MRELVLATTNPGKVKQISPFVAGLGFRVRTQTQVGILDEAEEDGLTYFDNALKKARHARRACTFEAVILSDDSGVSIRALDGQPGMNTKHWAGPGASATQTVDHALRMMQGRSDRFAIFETAVVLFVPGNPHPIHFSGKVEGELLEARRGEPDPGMPYSVIFVPLGHQDVLAEMSLEQRNRVSHRGRAFSQVRQYLIDVL